MIYVVEEYSSFLSSQLYGQLTSLVNYCFPLHFFPYLRNLKENHMYPISPLCKMVCKSHHFKFGVHRLRVTCMCLRQLSSFVQ